MRCSRSATIRKRWEASTGALSAQFILLESVGFRGVGQQACPERNVRRARKLVSMPRMGEC